MGNGDGKLTFLADPITPSYENASNENHLRVELKVTRNFRRTRSPFRSSFATTFSSDSRSIVVAINQVVKGKVVMCYCKSVQR